MASSETHTGRSDREAAGLGEKVYSFGEYRLIPSRQALLRGGYPVRIGTRALDLLCLLVDKQGELVSKEQLIGYAWPDTFVHESNLKVNIAALRRNLPQGRSEFPLIATVPGRGYRFVAPVRVEIEALPTFAPILVAPAHDNLPPQHAIVGRDEDVADLSAKLIATGFLTIVGPAGVGKTTAAVAIARQVAEHYEDGVRFIDFSTIGDARLVCPAIATAIGAGGALADVLCGILEALRGQRFLLVFDNCEHLLAAISLVADQIRAALPDIGVLATSREPLRSQFETVQVLAPLTCPNAATAVEPKAAMGFSAIELFVARANEAAVYELADEDVAAIAAICRRLDGIPLAIELAAPRLASESAASLLRRLEQSFESLNYGPRTAPARHQALLATLDWSYRLLSDREAEVLRLLSVFAGAFMLEDVIGLGAILGLPAEDVVRSVGNLATKSLLSSSVCQGQLLYRLLEATRAHARDRLRQAGEEARALAGHAQLMLSVCERAEQERQWRAAQDWTARYAPRTDDVRNAIDWALGQGDALTLGMRLTCAAISLWDQQSLVGESMPRLRGALRLAEARPDFELALRVKLQTAYAWGLTFSDRLGPHVEEAWRESLRLARETGSDDPQLHALAGLAVFLSSTGRHREALATLDAFTIVLAQEKDHAAGPDGERLRALTAFYRGDIRVAFRRLSALARDHGAVGGQGPAGRFQFDHYVAIRTALAMVAWVHGDTRAARDAAAAAVAGALAIEHVVSHANALALAALPVALWVGDLDAAEAHLAALVDNLGRRDIAIWGPVARFFAGAIRSRKGEPGGVEAMQAALEALLASNFLVRVPYYASMLAEAALGQGQTDIARASIDIARAHAERHDERWCLPEVLRVSGLIARQEGDFDGAERSFLEAIDRARDMGAGALELKAAASLAEHWAGHGLDQGRSEDALTLLQAVRECIEPGVGGEGLARVRSQLGRWQAIQAA